MAYEEALAKLKELHASGVLSDAEFDAASLRLLGSRGAGSTAPGDALAVAADPRLPYAPPAVDMRADGPSTVRELRALGQAFQVARMIGLALWVVSLVSPTPFFAITRSLAWAAAGVLLLIHARKSSQVGLRSSYGSAFLYFLIAAFPLLRLR